MSARTELTAMFAPFLSGKLLEDAARDAEAVVRREDIALIENAADDADFTEEPLYIVGLRSAADLLKAAPAPPVPDNTTGDEGELATRAIRAVHKLKSPAPSGSQHYRSGWDDGLEAAIDAIRTAAEGGESR